MQISDKIAIGKIITTYLLLTEKIMDYITYSERLDYLLDLIKNEKLNSPKEIADKFDCNEKTIRNMINCLREKGYEIDYSKCKKKYYIKN